MCVACDYTIHRANHHFGWNRDFAPALTAKPGSTIHFECTDASGGQLDAASTLAERRRPRFRQGQSGDRTGLCRRRQPGDALKVTIRKFMPSGVGWTANIPGFGLLADQFTEPALHIWKYDPASMAPALYRPWRQGAAEAVRRHDRPRSGRSRACIPSCRRAGSAAIWIFATSRPASRSICRSRSRARCSPSATPTPPRATARSAARPSRAR